MRVGVLGSTEVTLDGAPVELGTRKQRAVLAALALSGGRPVHRDALADLVWGDEVPAAVATTMQVYVARLRKVLEPTRAARAAAEVLVTRDEGYALVLPAYALDVQRFETAVRSAHDAVGAPEHPGGTDVEQVAAALDEALALWRGTPYAELGDAEAARVERARLEELRLLALEDRAVAAVRLGRHAHAAVELEQLTAEHPLRERLWWLRAFALARADRQADALEVLRQVRERLLDELGLEPGPELRDLQTAVLRQDPSLRGPSSAARPALPRPGWPMVGREQELAALTGLLDRSEPAFASLVGEPGIGKSRLCLELARVAEDRGATVLVGRCSQDDGAPPLHPWVSVLRSLGVDLPHDAGTGGGDDVAAFRAREEIVGRVLAAATERPVVLVLDDLHWADSSTLRVLRLLTETAQTGRLVVLATWRDAPAPGARLAEVADALARRHALRFRLAGLTETETRLVVGAVARVDPSAEQSRTLLERTDGNPFFLLEYARLAEGSDLDSLLAERDPPAAVHDVLRRRLEALPPDGAALLGVASVLGRSFEVADLAGLADVDEDVALDRLDEAQRAGLVREADVGRFGFAHALVRDTAYLGASLTRRARLHARAARLLTGRSGRESEVARQWLRAGPLHVGEAWRAAAVAAEVATTVFAFEEALALFGEAHGAIGLDPDATEADQLALLLAHAEVLKRAGNWVDLRPVVHRALALADAVRDVDALVQAATTAMTNALWQSGSHGEPDAVVVAALRRALDVLPSGDGDQRCRVMLSLAGEIYYGASSREREALAEEGLAMARRLGDPALLQWTLLSTTTSIWRGATARRRIDLAAEAADLARAAGDQIGLSAAMTLHTVTSGELGWDPGTADRLTAARAQARSLRHHYAEMVLDAFEVPWAAMRGERERVEELLVDLQRLAGLTSLIQVADTLGGAWAVRNLWLGTADELAATVETVVRESQLPVAPVAAAWWCRAGRRDRAEEYLRDHPVDLAADDWFSPMAWAMTAELAIRLDRTDLAAAVYPRLIDLRGRPACAGSGAAVGPTDAFLAMAALAVGDRDLAVRHADEAARLCETWRIPLVAAWWDDVRRELGL